MENNDEFRKERKKELEKLRESVKDMDLIACGPFNFHGSMKTNLHYTDLLRDKNGNFFVFFHEAWLSEDRECRDVYEHHMRDVDGARARKLYGELGQKFISEEEAFRLLDEEDARRNLAAAYGCYGNEYDELFRRHASEQAAFQPMEQGNAALENPEGSSICPKCGSSKVFIRDGVIFGIGSAPVCDNCSYVLGLNQYSILKEEVPVEAFYPGERQLTGHFNKARNALRRVLDVLRLKKRHEPFLTEGKEECNDSKKCPKCKSSRIVSGGGVAGGSGTVCADCGHVLGP